MTILVGIKCEDGVVVAADRAVAVGSDVGQFTVSHLACKIEVLSDTMIIAGAGSVGSMQRFCEVSQVVLESTRGQIAKSPPLKLCRTLSAGAIEDAKATHLRSPELGALVAFPSPRGPQLCEFSQSNFQPELKDKGTWFVSMGSAQQLGDAYLAFMREVFWKNGPPKLTNGLFAAAWVLKQSIKFSPGHVSLPIDIAVLQGERAIMLSSEEVQYHIDIADQATAHFRRFNPLDRGGEFETGGEFEDLTVANGNMVVAPGTNVPPIPEPRDDSKTIANCEVTGNSCESGRVEAESSDV